MSFLKRDLKPPRVEPRTDFSSLIRSSLHSRMAGFDEERLDEHLHASDLTRENFCPRAKRFAEVLNKPKEQYVSTCTRYTFDLGWLYHNEFVTNWAKEMSVVHWKCKQCENLHKFQLKPTQCGSCGSQSFDYVEPIFYHQTLKLSGSIDTFLKLKTNEKIVAVELKSIKQEDFKALLVPLPEHKLRTMLYLKLIEESTDEYKKNIETDHGYVIYMSKGYGASDSTLPRDGITERMSPFKVFRVERRDHFLESYFKTCEIYSEAKNSGLLGKGICVDENSRPFKTCAFNTKCFSDEFITK